jgi:Flp pilus assembly protein TadB
MSKERARRRAERQLLAERRQAAQQAARDRQLARQRRGRLWRRIFRAGRRGRPAASARTRERRAIIASTLLVVLVLTYLMTRSIGMVIGVLLIAAVATPALVAVLTNRSR